LVLFAFGTWHCGYYALLGIVIYCNVWYAVNVIITIVRTKEHHWSGVQCKITSRALLLQGVFHGVTGVVTKPIEGAKQEGVGGFFKGNIIVRAALQGFDVL